jgi:nicotinic acid mononucleotide adenylyltransferase
MDKVIGQKSDEKAIADTPQDDKPVKAKKKSVKKSSEDELLNKNAIEINPRLEEAVMRTVVLGWGRMNPITSGHEILVNKIKAVAKKIKATPIIYVSHSQDPKKNPLDYDDKIMIAKKAFGNNIIQKSKSRTIIQIMQELENSYEKVVLVVGSDRVKDFETLLNRYNGKDYTLKEIEVQSAGNRADPDSDKAKDLSAANMSASVMRKLASEGDLAGFSKGLPKKLKSDAQDIYDMVRGGMKIAEMTEEDDDLVEALNMQQRRARSLTMRKYKGKIAAARKRMAKKAATMDKLKARARKAAIVIIRKKIAGKKGENYAKLGPGEKMMIDKRVEKKKSAVDKIAKRLLPMVRKADLAKRSAVKKESIDFEFDNFLGESYNAEFELFLGESYNNEFESFLEEGSTGPRYHEMLKKDGTIKLDRRFRAFRNKKKPEVEPLEEVSTNTDAEKTLKLHHKDERENMSREHERSMDALQTRELRKKVRQINKEEFTDESALINFIEETANDIFDQVTLDEHKIEQSLEAKSIKSGVELEIIQHVYEEAMETYVESDTMDIHQWAFSCVNATIANIDEGKKGGLWDNIHKKRKRIKAGSKEKMRKPGSDGAPTNDDFENARSEEFAEKSPADYMKNQLGKVVHKKAYTHALKALVDLLDRKKIEGGKNGMKHGAEYYAAQIAKSYPKFINGRVLASMLPKGYVKEEGGAGDQSTDKVTKRYKKDTPGEAYNINEAFDDMFSEDVTQKQLNDLEKFGDRLLAKFKIDIEFTRHFADRMNDARNKPSITVAELQKVFKKIAKRKAVEIRQNPDSEAVLKDMQADLNLPIVINYDKNKDEYEVVNKTIMRKKNFGTSDKVIEV